MRFYSEHDEQKVRKVRVPDYVAGRQTLVKVHLVPFDGQDTGITGFFKVDDLLSNFRYNEAYEVSYLKDYGPFMKKVWRSFLAIIVDSAETVEYFRNYRKEVL